MNVGTDFSGLLNFAIPALRYSFSGSLEGFYQLYFADVLNQGVSGSEGRVTVDNCYTDAMHNKISFSGDNVELSNVQIFVPDVDVGGTVSRNYARGFTRQVERNVAEITVTDFVAPAGRSEFTPEGEEAVSVPVERVRYTLTPNDGLLTTYELGQAFDAELLSERAVLKGLAREAVSE
jgi:hypothetical protein